MFEDRIKDEIQSAVAELFNVHLKIDEIEISRPEKADFGDYATNASFQLAAKLKQNPTEIAEKLSTKITSAKVFEKVEPKGGFVNFFLKKEAFQQTVAEILGQKEKFAESDILKDKKIQVEFISANPTGPLTLGNGRGGFGGDVLANVLSKVGAKVEREYYVNDGGNQVKVLGESLLVAAGKLKKEKDIYRGEYIEEWVKQNEDLIEKHQENPFELGQLAAEDILEKHIKPSIEKLGINFNKWFHEKDLIEKGDVEYTLKKLQGYKLTKEEDGALWLKTTDFGDDKDRVLVKQDGEKTYFANDIAYHFDKLYKRKFDKVINFWGADHHGHVGRMQAAVAAMDCPGHLDIVIFQLVRLLKDGQEYKMSKRKGTYVTMDQLLELIGGETKEAADVARFFFLSRSFDTHMDFDLDLAREHSEKNPVFYVKYAYARLSGILRNAKELSLPEGDLKLLTETAEMELIDQLSQLPRLIQFIATSSDYPVHYLTFYTIEVAKKFHAFYDKCRVIDEENPELTAARLKLVEATKIVLGITMRDLIGIETPERM